MDRITCDRQSDPRGCPGRGAGRLGRSLSMGGVEGGKLTASKLRGAKFQCTDFWEGAVKVLV